MEVKLVLTYVYMRCIRMISVMNNKSDVEAAIQELNRINKKYSLPNIYHSYISYIAWKMNKDYHNGHGAFNAGGEQFGQKAEEKEEKTGENLS